jgi:phosphoribosyl 1,2-cyclic phosphate phosphodiesterase
MQVTFLGTGTSGGVPSIGCDCDVCRSTDPRDKRLRCSALVETETTRILIDCGPDFRQQILSVPFKKIDGVLITHIHYDHVAGIDDMRPFCKFGDIDIYADNLTVRGLKHNMPYCFTEHLYPGVPLLNLHTIQAHKKLRIGDIDVIPITVMHDKMPILGYRFGRFAYITDMKSIDEGEYKYLSGVEVLVVNALRFKKEHHSHQLVADAIRFSHRVGAKRTLLIHSNHHIGLHEHVNRILPEGFELAYDGQVMDI